MGALRSTEHAVVIAGGGPTGMMLAGELTLGGIDVVIVERRASNDIDGSRAGELHARTIEVLDQRGIADRFLAEGTVMQTNGYAYIPLDISDFPSRHNYGLALWQKDFERILGGWIDELGVPIVGERAVAGFTQGGAGVDVELSDGQSLRAAYLVGCDGGRSAVRKAAGIDFAGLDATSSWLVAEVEMTSEPEIGVRREGGGIGPVDREKGGGPYGVVLKERLVDHPGEPTLDDLHQALIAAYGTGGHGLNTGVQDAVNLVWKLAQVVSGISPDTLLDTYHAERHPVGALVLHNTMAQVALTTPDDRHDALRATLTDLLAMDGPRRHMAGMLSGLATSYDLGDGHPLVGHRMPDLDLQTSSGSTRVFALLQAARPVLLNGRDPGAFDAAAAGGRIGSPSWTPASTMCGSCPSSVTSRHLRLSSSAPTDTSRGPASRRTLRCLRSSRRGSALRRDGAQARVERTCRCPHDRHR